jgi:hypothetical protein
MKGQSKKSKRERLRSQKSNFNMPTNMFLNELYGDGIFGIGLTPKKKARTDKLRYVEHGYKHGFREASELYDHQIDLFDKEQADRAYKATKYATDIHKAVDQQLDYITNYEQVHNRGVNKREGRLTRFTRETADSLVNLENAFIGVSSSLKKDVSVDDIYPGYTNISTIGSNKVLYTDKVAFDKELKDRIQKMK